VNTGYHSDLQGGLHLTNGAHDSTITGDDFSGNRRPCTKSASEGLLALVPSSLDEEVVQMGRRAEDDDIVWFREDQQTA
jgi:hypothetical protein